MERFVQVIRFVTTLWKIVRYEYVRYLDSIGEIVSLSKKHVFFTDAQRKYFVANKQDIEELSIRKIIIIDTGLFHIKGNLLLQWNRSDVDYSRIEVDLLYKKKISMNFYEMVSRNSANCLDRGISLRNRNRVIKGFTMIISSME
ncbi:hypothetical protein Scep_002208 [Stephania cephalantha]|uniref:Uncharacterized protein n=1 Tax=Stephania cephalantha TaxID=152367 RepID=A0AAP0Q436_9MAGN